MPQVVWKGAISFGLVNIPVTLRAASRAHALDFDWLDKRDMAPVGYKRINKKTGKEMEADNVVKGFKYESDQYVLMSDEDFRQANPKATQTVDIVGFVDVEDIAPEYFQTPYHLEAVKRGEKGYALLREVLKSTGRAGLAKVVMHNRQHLATLLARGPGLMLNTLRFADEVFHPKDLYLPSEKLSEVGVSSKELDMARRLVDDMAMKWKPEEFSDTYRDDLMSRIEEKIRKKQTHTLTPVGEEPAATGGAKVIDLMAALRQSLRKGGGGEADTKTGPAVAAKKGASAKKAPAKAASKTAPGKPAKTAAVAKKTAVSAPRRKAA